MELFRPSVVLAFVISISCFFAAGGAEPSQVLDIGKDNIDAIVAQYDVVFVNFYAEWCKFSRMLAPIFEQTAAKIKADFPQVNKVALGRIDCDKEADTCAAYHISKYPSLKLWRSGQVAKREYRGQRTMDAFVQHLHDQLKDPILPINSVEENETPEKRKKRAVYLHFSSNQVPYWHNVQRMASYLRDECPFYVVFGSTGPSSRQPGGDAVVFRELIGSTFKEDLYQGPLDDYNVLNQWIYDRCVPLVREITFENAEELTEEGLPFLIMFHKAEDLKSEEIYKQEIQKQLLGDRNTMNFLTADGEKFSHPLQHLGKSQADLPLIAIDSFRHMYLFPSFNDITIPGKLKSLIEDLHSGKLHRVFHYGFDPNEPATEAPAEIGGAVQAGDHIPVEDVNARRPNGGNLQSPPESTFKKLAPSRNRLALSEQHKMLSLGYFYQQKKLSLQAQEAEAHGAFLRIIDLMRSTKPVDHVEAISLCGQICSRFASPTIVNSAFMRMAEAFRMGSNTLQLEILRVVQKNTQHLPKIRNHGEFIRPIFTVMYSNDPVARAITLRLLAAIAVSIPNQLDVHHAVRVALQSKDRSELQAALFACLSLAKISGKFAEEIAADVIMLVDKPGLSDDERIATLQVIPYIAGMRLDTDMVTSVVSRILEEGRTGQYQSSRVIETCLRTISDLLARSSKSESLKNHIFTITSYVHNNRPEVSKPAAFELRRFFRLCASQLEPSAISDIISQLLDSENVHVIKQGIACAYFFVTDPLTCGSVEVVDGRIARQITNYAFRLRTAGGACAFAVLCRIIALNSSGSSSSADPPSELVTETCQSVVRLCQVMQKLLEEKPDVRVLRLVLLGFSSANLRNFPSDLATKCLLCTSKFSFPGPVFQLIYLRHLRDLIAVDPKKVEDLLDCSNWSAGLVDCHSDTVYRILFHFVALRCRLADIFQRNLDEEKLADDVLAFGLTHWHLYRLVRSALADGRHVFAAKILQHVLAYPHSAAASNWLNILLSLSQAEAGKANLRAVEFSLSSKSEAIQKSVLRQMDTHLSLSSFCSSNRLGLFRKKFLELRINIQQSLLLVMTTVEKIRLRAASMKESAGVLKCVSSQLVGPLSKLKSTAEESVRLYRLSFDADGPSLLVIRLYFDICISLGKTIAATTKRAFSVDGILPNSSAQIHGTENIFTRLAKIHPDVSEVVTLYDWLKDLFLAATFFLQFSVPIPRYFSQQFQQTTLSVILTPAPNADKDYAQTVSMDTRFSLKVDGVLSVERPDGRQLMRKVKAVRLITRIILLKSLPFSSKALSGAETPSEGMVEDLRLNGLSFFSHTFVMNLGYPGVYRVEVDFEFHDEESVAWTAMQTVDLTVRVVESFGNMRKAGPIYEGAPSAH